MHWLPEFFGGAISRGAASARRVKPELAGAPKRPGDSSWVLLAAILGAAPMASALAQAGASPAKAPHRPPDYFPPTYQSALRAPLPNREFKDHLPAVFRQQETFDNRHGKLGSWNTLGTVITAGNAFFKPLGTNGRTCFSCHRPAESMSISAATLRKEFQASQGRDPVFAPVDGANCPSQVPAGYTAPSHVGQHRGRGRAPLQEAYSLLLNRGLFRVFLPVPENAEFTVKVLSDPYGCNTDPVYARVVAGGKERQIVSVYRRPRMSANLRFMTEGSSDQIGVPRNYDILTGELLVDPADGAPISGNLMWDGREPTLKSQARSATLGHAQALREPTQAELQQMVDLENAFFLAQDSLRLAGGLSDSRAGAVYGGAQHLAALPASPGGLAEGFRLYDSGLAPAAAAGRSADSAQQSLRASIARGQQLFNARPITLSNVAGLNNLRLGAGGALNNPAQVHCVTCHGNLPAGSEIFARGQRAIGMGGQHARLGGPAPDKALPIFEVRCKPGFAMPFLGTRVTTNDPGLALITGRCADVGRTSVPQVRALAGRAPYFSNGSAATVEDVVKFYDRRFGIGLTAQDIGDLANFLRAL
jgi:hypothetical protein